MWALLGNCRIGWLVRLLCVLGGVATQQQQSMAHISHVRNPLLRSVYSRMLEDERERTRDHVHWYMLDRAQLGEELCDKFVQSHEDAETKLFLDSCYEKADWVFTQLYHLLAKSVLSWFMTNTSINGLLNRGSMFVISMEQFCALLGVDDSWQGDRLLDMGAGDGMVTRRMAPFFKEVYVTEVSLTMTWRLQEHGYHILGLEEWATAGLQFDVISCLNLLDRCDRPITMLHQIRQALVPGSGRLLLAVVLPFKPYVENGDNEHRPVEYLHVGGSSMEAQVTSLVRDVFQPAGFTLQTLTRVPYLCEGDLEHSFYYLHDVVLF